MACRPEHLCKRTTVRFLTCLASKMIGTLGQANLDSGRTLSMTALRATKMASNLLSNDNWMHCFNQTRCMPSAAIADACARQELPRAITYHVNYRGPWHVTLSCATCMISRTCCEQGCEMCGDITCSEFLHPLQFLETTCQGACPATPPLPQICIDISNHQMDVSCMMHQLLS